MFEESLTHDALLLLLLPENLSIGLSLPFCSVSDCRIEPPKMMHLHLPYGSSSLQEKLTGRFTASLEMFGISPAPTPPLAIDATSVDIDPRDLINGFSADEIFSSADCQGNIIAIYLLFHSSH